MTGSDRVTGRSRWAWWRKGESNVASSPDRTDISDGDTESALTYRPPKWNMGIMNDKYTDEVPGSILLLSQKEGEHNEPLGLHYIPSRASASSLPSPFPPNVASPVTPSRIPFYRAPSSTFSVKKKTPDGQIILDPQPDESANDPLNWPRWRRDMALASLGYICMLGGGTTTIIASGFSNVADTYGVSVPQVSLTTGIYMLGLGIGSVIFSPTAILWGKRPVYLLGGTLFILSSVWCALSPNYASLIVARIFQGIAVSPVECLPSATIAEIFFLHERAYRLGIYTLLLLGGKNLVPLVSSIIINDLGWRWSFWVMAMLVGLATILLFFFIPETFWDRTPVPGKHRNKKRLAALTALLSPTKSNAGSVISGRPHPNNQDDGLAILDARDTLNPSDPSSGEIAKRRRESGPHAHFADSIGPGSDGTKTPEGIVANDSEEKVAAVNNTLSEKIEQTESRSGHAAPADLEKAAMAPTANGIDRPAAVATATTAAQGGGDYFTGALDDSKLSRKSGERPTTSATSASQGGVSSIGGPESYTRNLQNLPALSYWATLRPWNGRVRRDSWLKCAVRPFVLYAYPAILWSALVYSLSVGWLIVVSESITTIFRSEAYTYRFDAMQTGLIYISPFIGGILGTAVAGRISDVIVRAMARRNDGVYEPEFRLVMAVPMLLATVAGLMGFGWSAQDHDAWIVPAVFFGTISFGCTLGSTTAITFAVDSYRQYAGEALVTLNFSKNVLHGFVFSLFFTGWLEADGSKMVYVVVGAIQVACLLTTIPMYIYGKRMRMWTVRKNMMEKF